MNECKAISCHNPTEPDVDFCERCRSTMASNDAIAPTSSLAQRYPKYYKALPAGLTELDVYAVHALFQIQDPSGQLQHASKKILLAGSRTGGKNRRDDIREARDTLDRWLQLYDVGLVE